MSGPDSPNGSHHLLADEYTTDFGLGTSRADREALINAFAIHFLMPRSSVLARWSELSKQFDDPRTRLVVLAAEYQVSWSAAVSHAATLELISHTEMERLRNHRPKSVDYLALRIRLPEELAPKSLAPAYTQAVVRAYRRAIITVDRAVELLRQTVGVEDLLPPPESHLEDLAAERLDETDAQLLVRRLVDAEARFPAAARDDLFKWARTRNPPLL